MTVSPAPPTDLPGLIDAFEQTARAVLDLGRAAGEERSSDPTPCPGWDVFAQVAHVESLESMFDGEAIPDLTIGERAHVRNDMGVIVELFIESRRGLSLEQLCDRLDAVIGRRVEFFRAAPPDKQLQSPFGTMSLTEFLGLRCFDIWTHEQDLRETLGTPGNLDSPAASISMSRMYASLGRIAVASGLPMGASLTVELTGPVTGRERVKVVDKNGKLRGVPVRASDESTVTLSLDTRSAGRFVAGREAVGDADDGAGEFGWFAYGDSDTAAAVIRHFAVTP